MKKNILFLQVLFPDIEKEETLYTELAEEFHKNGYNVYVVTIQDYIGEAEKKRTFLHEQRGINILRVKTPTKYFNTNFIQKGLTTVMIPYLFSRAIKKHFKGIKFDFLVSISIIPGLYKTIHKIKKRDNCKIYLLLRDIFPQMARDMGVLPEPIYSHFKRQQIKLYNISDVIGCMSQGNIDYVKRNLPQVSGDKLTLLPNWKTIKEHKEQSTYLFRQKYGLENKVIAMFGGVIGIQQGLDFLLDLAFEMKEYDELRFVIMGNGTEKSKLVKICNERKLSNVMILDRVSSYEYDEILNQCDIGLINLHGDVNVPHIPSKTLSYLEAGKPILAAVSVNTDYGKILEENNCGFCCAYGDIKNYKSNMIKLLDSKTRTQLGDNAKKYIIDKLQTKDAVKSIEDQLNFTKDV